MRMMEHCKKKVVAELQKNGRYKNPMQMPRLEKIVINMSVRADADRDVLKAVAEDLAKISGQRPQITKSTKNIANFHLREGMPIGCKVTLRGARMYAFLEKLIHVALPRIRDFRGVPVRGFDGRGNFTLGLKEQTIFPEIAPDQIKKTQGMDVTMVTSATNNEDAKELLLLIGMPFAKRN